MLSQSVIDRVSVSHGCEYVVEDRLESWFVRIHRRARLQAECSNSRQRQESRQNSLEGNHAILTDSNIIVGLETSTS